MATAEAPLGTAVAATLSTIGKLTAVLKRLSYRINHRLERHLPEQRLFLKSDAETRFIRLRPATQAVAVAVGTLVLGWTIVATAVLLMDSIGAESSRDQAYRQQVLFERRLTDLSQDRDARAADAADAQARFNLALDQVSQMQARLLASENRRREAETGIDVIQNTLRRTMLERDGARAEAQTITAAMEEQTGAPRTDAGQAQDTVATLRIVTAALGDTARQRDATQLDASHAAEVVTERETEIRRMAARNDAIFTQLEEAVSVSMEPLDAMFRSVGLSPDDMLDEVRKGYSGQGGPLTAAVLSSKGVAISADEARASAILSGLDEMNLYRLAAARAPFALPLSGSYRMTSGFGYRRDPNGWGTRMHEGTDMAGSHGTPVEVTADGEVIHAGWQGAYGQLIKVRHAFGIETRYGHLSDVHVKVGQKVSRGDHIGDMGNTGRSTGTHLHYEVRIGGSPVNPMTFIKAARDVF